jgi:UDP-N-acetylenolpyruvoylglucosamine reductase
MIQSSAQPSRSGGQLAEKLRARVSAATAVLADEPLARRTTLRVGGPADVLVEPASEADLSAALAVCAELGEKFLVLGRGSNLLVRDGGFRGVVISLGNPVFSRIEVDGERLRCGAGARLKAVANEAKRQALTGVEFLEGIPGSVGGALRMNAGAMGGATFDAVESVWVMNQHGVALELLPGEFDVEYRCCPMLKTNVALGAVFRCRPSTREAIEQRMQAFSEKRWSSQPAAPSAGCMFKNPATIPAGRLIDELGLKGTRVGGAMVSFEHGNFIVNDGAATARDVLELIAVLKSRAMSERGVALHAEVEVVGED